MNRRIPLAAIAMAILSAATIRAQAPDILSHYHVIPRLSTLAVSGGFLGVDQRYRLIGEYDFLRLGGPPFTAKFDNAEIWGSLISGTPTIAIVEDVDEILNLENLHGKQLHVAAPFDVYEFTGQTGDGSEIRLLSALIGRWMYVRGGTVPPPDGADFFEYQLRMVSRRGPSADLNEDGVVDAADYTLLRDQDALLPAGLSVADWGEQFGEQAPFVDVLDSMMSAALASLTVASVPEPSSMFLVVIGFVAAGSRRRLRLSS